MAGFPRGSPEHRPLLLCLSHLRWRLVYQRPQHLMARAAREYRVLYWEEPVVGDAGGEAVLRRECDPSGVEIVTPVLTAGLDEAGSDAAQRALLDDLLAQQAIRPAVLWYYTPLATEFASHIQAGVTVYDCMDELSLFAGASPRLLLAERRLLRAAGVVFTGGRSLHAAKRLRHANVRCYPSAVDAGHFARARGGVLAEPADQAPIPQPRIGYFGVLDERLDRELVAEMADRRPDWHFVLLGPVVKIAEETLPQRPNLHWLGAKPYADLPRYLAGWDAGYMPFALNDATRFISPTKTPEFLAAGVPLVSTPVADVVGDWGQRGLVRIANDAAAMERALAAAFAAPRAEWLAGVDDALRGVSWDLTWAGMRRDVARAGTWCPQGAPARERAGAYDWLVVGAGFAGAVLAERIAEQRDERVLVIDKRGHIAGNAHDRLNAAGLMIHEYGPHIFHTNSADIAAYLSAFTAWRPYEHRVRALVDGKMLPIPINLDTINTLYGLALREDELEGWFAARAETVAEIRTSEDVVVSRVGRELYEKFFRGYTRKQWGLDPSALDRAVTARIPVRTNRDDRYFSDSFQNMPRDGYTAMFGRMLDHPNITLALGTDYARLRDRPPAPRLVWTGPIDEFFGFTYGRLPYRSLRFDHQTLDCAWHQDVAVVNYPQTEAFTRVTEYKHLTGQTHARTAITREYPKAEGDPYYPVPRPENATMYRLYRGLAENMPDTWFAGRLATYQYMNMDQVVGQALATFRRIEQAVPRRRAPTRVAAGGAAPAPRP